ncbi:phospholipase D-like domain-containing protein [Paraburkholderia sp. SOS3]|uniref:phospholipase D-like domain-containing protein n=1 Tax=Paraburkholderia sp. SOS3 TaxID=1926494 RepID=UPI0009474F62|nr:phospholipase D-like domain-containing protein [Paraburkholderia sp. SOS3]APR35265.1 hypothetical protein BTO02_07285 [Paraburkholderia sp. SOS3]
MSEHLNTQNPVDVSIDEQGRTASSSGQFFLENDPRVKKYYGNTLDFLICGEEGFRSIAKDLKEAKASADIICWGFDPGMELERDMDTSKLSGGGWPRGLTYGALLEQLAGRGVRVRLLIWSNRIGSLVQKNMPGYSDAPRGPFASNYVNIDTRQKYCIDWWLRNLPFGGGPANPNLQIMLRDVSKSDASRGLDGEEDRPSGTESALMEWFGTHHQKPVLIDYEYDGGSQAVGYVMGLNSVTDFWDRLDHEVEDPLRERWSSKNGIDENRHEMATEAIRSTASYKHTKPYQDYACRIVGPALERLHQNFVRGWNADRRKEPAAVELASLPPRIPTSAPDPNRIVQIVRTQAREKEKTIKALYFQATSWARNYIYIENQYFFYPEFARHLKKEREKFCQAWCRSSGKPLAEIPTLYLFIVIAHPEQDGMVPRTADTLTELGHSDAMREQIDLIDREQINQNYYGSVSKPYTTTIVDPMGGIHQVHVPRRALDRPSLEKLEATLGMKVSVARLRTSGLDANHEMAYREIYIHSKLMMIDDVFVTMGSANLNQRSMAVDSEINIGASGHDMVSALRKRVFELHSGGEVSGSGDPLLLQRVFDNWNKAMNRNAVARKKGMVMQGFLLKFEDHRSTTLMVASAHIPSSNFTV